MKKKSKYLMIILFISLCSVTPAFSTPDLSIVGFFEPEGGIGKVPITILECLGDRVSTNFISTDNNTNYSNKDIPKYSLNAVNNPDKSAGNVALLTDTLWDVSRKASDRMPKNSLVKLAYSMLETTEIPSMWVKILNDEFDAVVVPDKYLVGVYQNCGVTIPVFVLPIPMILDPYLNHPGKEHPSKPFIFGDASVNKNPEILLNAFAKAFKNNPNVLLVLRAGGLTPNTERAISNAQKKYNLNTVCIDSGKIPLNQFIERVSTFDCYINLSRGEGFSLIPREMLALGIPSIITNNTASTTICESGFVCSIPCHIKNTANAGYMSLFGEQCGQQFDCEVNDVIKALRHVYNNYSTYKQLAKQGCQWVMQYDCANPTLQNMYQTLVKPKNVVFGTENKITEDSLITNSESLYRKYSKISKKTF